MASRPVVICEQCGRPQLASGAGCVACGAALPEPAAPRPPSNGRDRLLADFDPFLVADLGRGRSLSLSMRRLEWRPGGEQSPIALPIAELKAVRLARRPVYETLIFTALSVAGALWLPRWPALAMWILTGLTLVACFGQRRYALEVDHREGQQGRLVLGLFPLGTEAVRRLESAWASLASELEVLGVEAGAKKGRGDR